MHKAYIIILFCLLSCSQRSNPLEPDRLPSHLIKSALVYTPSPAYRVRSDGKDLISIESVDGNQPTFHNNKIIIEPGIHTLQIRMEFWENSKRIKDESVITKVDSDITFQVEARKEYLINAERNDQGIWLWAEDIDTKEVVGGTRP